MIVDIATGGFSLPLDVSHYGCRNLTNCRTKTATLKCKLLFLQILNQRAIEASDKERPTPDLRTGDIVEIKLVIYFFFFFFGVY